MWTRLMQFWRTAGPFGVVQTVVIAALMADHLRNLPPVFVRTLVVPALILAFVVCGLARAAIARRAPEVSKALERSFFGYLAVFVGLHILGPFGPVASILIVLGQYLWMAIHCSLYFWLNSRPPGAGAWSPDVERAFARRSRADDRR